MSDGTVAEPLPAGERRGPGWVAYGNPGPIESEENRHRVVELDDRDHGIDPAVILGSLVASGIYALIALPICLLLV